MTKKLQNNDEEYKEETSKIEEGNESVDNSETSDNLSDESIIKTKKKGSIDSTVEDYEFPISCNKFCDKYCSFVWGKMIELAR